MLFVKSSPIKVLESFFLFPFFGTPTVKKPNHHTQLGEMYPKKTPFHPNNEPPYLAFTHVSYLHKRSIANASTNQHV
jgi:hypothetical protein